VTSFGAIGFFGKTSAQGDFVRLGVADEQAQKLARWLEEASEACHRAGAALPARPLRFAFRPAGAARLQIGALLASADKVGRTFPLAVFTAVDGPELAQGFPALPAAARTFLGAVEALLADGIALPAGELADRVRRLVPPPPAALAEAQAAARVEVEGEEAQAFFGRLLGDPARGERHYALRTLLLACEKVRGREPTRAEVVLDAPLEGPGDAHAWLELARRALGWPAPPPFFWREGPAGRLLLPLGAPPGAVLPAFAEPPRDNPKIWPLRTAQASAVEASRKALGAKAAVIDRPGATVGELLAALSR
jgi:type VI secretion system protein ImpM